MNTNRRNFIKSAGAGTLAVGFLPIIKRATNLFDPGFTSDLSRATPESQGVSSKDITKFIDAANASGIGWHSFMLLRHE